MADEQTAPMEDRVAAVMGLVEEAPAAPKLAAVPKQDQPAPPVPEGDDPDDLDLGEEEEVAAPPPTDDAIELEIAGEQKRLTKAELKALAEEHSTFKRDHDTFKAQREAVETERRTVAQVMQLAPQVEAIRAEGRMLLQMMNGLDQEAKTLAESDPIAAYQKREQFNGLQQRFQWLASQESQVSAQMQQLQAQSVRAQLAAEAPKLLEKMPQWKDSAKRDSDMKFIREYMKTEGYSDQEIGMVTRSHYVSTLLKAAKYEALRAKQASKKVVNAPQMARPGAAPAPGAQAVQAKTDYRKAVNAANAKGDFHKAARIAEAEFARRLK